MMHSPEGLESTIVFSSKGLKVKTVTRAIFLRLKTDITIYLQERGIFQFIGSSYEN
jgi:hypothetical protein